MNSKLVAVLLILNATQGILLVTAADFVCPTQGGFYPADDLCSAAYYTCVDGDAFLMECPGTTVFDPANSTCVSLQDASCNLPTTTVMPFACPSSEGFYPVPGTCSSDYFVCVAGVSALTTCPFGAIFDPVVYQCVSADQASCKQPFYCSGTDGLFPYPGACSGIYYNCTGGQSNLLYCPEGTVFDPLVSECVANEIASCTPGVSTTSAGPTTTAAPTSPACPVDGYYPIAGNCTVYYICKGGVGFVAPCADGLVFNPDAGYCDFPQNVPSCNVTASQIMERANEGAINRFLNRAIGQFICKNDGLFPLKSKGRFSAYYSCTKGIALPKACPGNQIFDPIQTKCL